MRFAIYARKSTESVDRQVQSLDDQIRELTNLATRENYTVVEIFQESRSAKAPGNRPEFDRMLNIIEAGDLDGVLTWAINRLSRNPVDGGRIAYLLQTRRLSMIRTIEKPYLPDDNALLLSIENGMSTAYIQDLSRNVKRGMRGKFERGWLPAKAPVGYRNDFDSKEIIVDPQRFGLVRRGWDMLLTGDYSVAQLVDRLQAEGLTYYRRGKQPLPVSRNTVYRMLRDRFYVGEIKFNGETRTGKHQAMVSESEFEHVQRILAGRHRSTRKRKHDFPFHGSFICEHCGCAIVGEKKFKSYPGTKRNVEYVYYHCTGRRGCGKQGIRQEQLAMMMASLAEGLRISQTYEDWLARTLPEAIEFRNMNQVPKGQVVAVNLDKERARLDALVTLRADGEIGADEFNRSRNQILDRITHEQRIRCEHERRSAVAYESMTKAIRALTVSRHARRYPQIEELAALAKELRPSRLSPTSPRLEVAPILQKIVAFEPLVLSNQNSESDDDLTSHSNWLGFWDDVLTLMENPLAQ
ncbi:MAG: recombinase family protein [Methanoregulaceae archaeon]|nr:recombinase family protein [Methanoregulaceae archaeon]